jgi:FkbM family methyltransferase
MVDFNDLRRAGRSTTGSAWLTNPVRRGIFKIVGPYLDRLGQAINENRRDTANGLEGLQRKAEALEQLSNDIGDRARNVGVLKDELLGLGSVLDGLRKDQRALAHRLGGLEDEADAARQSSSSINAQLLQLVQMFDMLRGEQTAVRHDLGAAAETVDALRQSGGALRDQLFTFGGLLEALRGEQHTAQARLDTMENDITTIRPPTTAAGMATLLQNQPIAIFGTSLLLHSGPYGHFLLRQPDIISDHILSGAFWDSHLKPVIESAAGADRNAIDAGAYFGFHTVYMSRYFRTVYTFEPQIEIFRMLCTNLLLNNCRNVIATNAALYDSPGYMRMADNAAQEIPVPTQDGALDYDRVRNAAALTFRTASADEPATVPRRTVDELGLTDLGFMKVDTQGSDLHVLRGAHNTIQRCRPVIATEYERELAQEHGNTLDDYYGYFNEINYNVKILDDRSNGKQVDLLATPQ